MTCRCSPLAAHTAAPHYFVCVMDYRSAGQEAVVDPEITRAEVISRLKTREYKDVVFIHEICDGIATDVTLELIGEARNLVFA
jgi:hypothetical protein